MSLTIVPFAEEHIEPAAALLAERHRCDRTWAPGLPAAYEAVDAARSALVQTFAEKGTRGFAAVRGGHLAGYMLGVPALMAPAELYAGFVRSRSAEVLFAGHAAEPADCGLLYRALYTELADHWLADGLTAHYVTAPANRATDDVWLDLGFARFIEMGIVETALAGAADDGPADVTFRQAGPDDEDAVQTLVSELFRSFADAPIFVPFLPETAAARRQSVTEHLADPTCPHWLALCDGQPVAMLLFKEPTSPHWNQSKMESSERGLYCSLACTMPEARGTGLGAALFRRSMAWARDAGYERCSVHYFNASRASSFWRGLGFQPASRWMVRAIDERAVWANGRNA